MAKEKIITAISNAINSGEGYDFDNYKNDGLQRPRDIAFSNWAKFEKVGDKVQGYLRDAFYRAPEGVFSEQRGLTIEQDGTLVNVGIKRLPFLLPQTDNLHIGDPLTIELVEIKEPKKAGLSGTKVFGYYGKALPENATSPTVREMEALDIKAGGTVAIDEKDKEFNETGEDIPFAG